MALLLRGNSKCPICSNVIQQEDDVTVFPHFILNQADALFPLSDAACHSNCVNSDAVGRQMLVATRGYYACTGPGKRICVVCENEVSDPDDYLLIGYLGRSTGDALGRFEYTHLHRSHIHEWKQVDEFLSLAKKAINSDQWQGDALYNIIREIEATRNVETKLQGR